MMPPPMYGHNYNILMYQQHVMNDQLMTVQKNVDKQMKEIEQQKQYHALERENKQVLYDLGMACKNDTITSKSCFFQWCFEY